MSDLKVFGIRHHGPGSSRRLLNALESWSPDCILIEFPSDAQQTMQQIGQLNLVPPVALVIYDQNNIQEAFYYPFTRFSPEWQALQWASRNQVPTEAIDLPVGVQLKLKEQVQLQLNPVSSSFQKDPLGEVAALAGFTDKEQWWELTFEQEQNDFVLFEAINELITALRAEQQQQHTETLIREAHMRKIVRKALKGPYERIAVVCGAWHAPAILDTARFKASVDNKILRGLQKVKIKAAWIPWSYPRMAKESGYGAGVHSPAWYELLYDYSRDATTHWMVKAAQLLRTEGMDTSPAHALEAVHLAFALAAMRQQAIPNLEDLRSAALSTLCLGSEERLSLIEKSLLLGNKVGVVPENASVVPLQKDLSQRLKSSRINKYWGLVGEQWLKATKANPRGGIDLRTESDLLKSELLHQLQILDIHWGSRHKASTNDLGAFKELWRLDWHAEFSLQVLEAAMWGNTVFEAAENKLRIQDKEADMLTLSNAVLLGLRANLKEGVRTVTGLLRDRSAVTRNVQELLSGLPALIKIIQYGDARKTDVTALAILLEEITPRLASSLPGAAIGIDEEAAQLLLTDFLATHRGLCQLALPLLDESWWPAVKKLANIPGVAPLLKGLAVRLLFDQERLSLQETSTRLDYALSPGNQAIEVTSWLSGFLNGSGLLLLHHPPLWTLVDQWVQRLDMDDLQAVLPLLRRTFSEFSPGERRQMLDLVTHPKKKLKSAATTTKATPQQHPLNEKLLVDIRGWIG